MLLVQDVHASDVAPSESLDIRASLQQPRRRERYTHGLGAQTTQSRRQRNKCGHSERTTRPRRSVPFQQTRKAGKEGYVTFPVEEDVAERIALSAEPPGIKGHVGQRMFPVRRTEPAQLAIFEDDRCVAKVV